MPPGEQKISNFGVQYTYTFKKECSYSEFNSHFELCMQNIQNLLFLSFYIYPVTLRA
jgi:hypothetical protein